MATTQTPEVTWAQRSSSSTPEKNVIYLTIAAPDVPASELKVDLKPGSLSFTGHSETKKTTYHVTLDFYADVDVDASKTHHSARDVAFVLRKKDAKDEYWPRLTQSKEKLHFLKTDFDKWVDEDEQDAVNEDDPMAGMGGMPGMGGDGGFGGLDFSKLGGGAGGMPDMSSLGAGAGLGGDDDDDDEDMPDLEDEEGKDKPEEAADASKPKIEEVA